MICLNEQSYEKLLDTNYLQPIALSIRTLLNFKTMHFQVNIHIQSKQRNAATGFFIFMLYLIQKRIKIRKRETESIENVVIAIFERFIDHLWR